MQILAPFSMVVNNNPTIPLREILALSTLIVNGFPPIPPGETSGVCPDIRTNKVIHRFFHNLWT